MNGGVIFCFGCVVLGCFERRPNCVPPGRDGPGGPDRIVRKADDPSPRRIHLCFGRSGLPLAGAYPVLCWDDATCGVAGAPDTEEVAGTVVCTKLVAVAV